MLPCLFYLKTYTVNIFEYIAQSDPYAAKAICGKYGYELQNVQSNSDLAVCLSQLVAEVGEPAMRDILSQHPDKDVILEAFSSGSPSADCGCKKSKKDAYMPQPSSQVKDSHFMIFAGALLLAAAIIAKN